MRVCDKQGLAWWRHGWWSVDLSWGSSRRSLLVVEMFQVKPPRTSFRATRSPTERDAHVNMCPISNYTGRDTADVYHLWWWQFEFLAPPHFGEEVHKLNTLHCFCGELSGSCPKKTAFSQGLRIIRTRSNCLFNRYPQSDSKMEYTQTSSERPE